MTPTIAAVLKNIASDVLMFSTITAFPSASFGKCSGRDKKQLQENPIYRLNSGVRYKILQPGIGSDIVKENSKLDLIYSIDIGGKVISDSGLGTKIQERDIPLGIEQALVGMKKGERRRVELPPNVGYGTSDWKPQPKSRRAQAGLKAYRKIIEGNASNQPPFSASTIWDLEVLKIHK